MQLKITLLFSALLLATNGCSQKTSEVEATSAETTQSQSSGTAASIGANPATVSGHRSAAVSTSAASSAPFPNGNSWQETLEASTDSERKNLETLNNRYFGALAYSSKEELEQLRKLGFPSPTDWIKAQLLSDTDLQERYQRGNIVAGMIYADRLISQAENDLRRLRSTNTATHNSGDLAVAIEAAVLIGELKSQSNSPFLAYQYAAMRQALDMEPQPERTAGALLAASARGDSRAQGFYDQFSRIHKDMNADLIAINFELNKPNAPAQQPRRR